MFDSALAEIDNPSLFSRMQDLPTKIPVDSLGPKSNYNAIGERLTYLPCLPRVRVQGCYQADSEKYF